MHPPSPPEPDRGSNRCRICGTVGEHEAFTVRERMFGWGETFRYFECEGCGCLQIAEIPEDLERFYPTDYYSFGDRPETSGHALKRALVRARDRAALGRGGPLDRALLRRFPRPELESLAPLDLDPTSRILDVGSGTGRLLYALRGLGFENLLGVDPFIENDISYANGLEVLKAEVSEVEGTWDVVMLHHTLEHLLQPQEILRGIKDLLAPDGVCVVRIPIVPCWAWDHYGTHWVQLDAPRHITIHSPDSLAHLADSCGLRVGDTAFDSTEFQFWGSEQYRREIALHSDDSFLVSPRRSPFSRAEVRGFRRRADELNRERRGDQAVFYLERR